MMRYINIFWGIIACVNVALASGQLEIKAGDVAGETTPGNGDYGSNGALLTGTFSGTFPLAHGLELLVADDCDNLFRISYDGPGSAVVKKVSPFFEKTIPSSNNVSAGVRYTGFGDLRLSLASNSFFDAQPIYPAFLQTEYTPSDSLNYAFSGDAVTRQMRNNIDAYWADSIYSFSVLADINYFGLWYSLDHKGVNFSTSADTSFGTTSDVFSDVWSRGQVAWNFAGLATISGELLAKNNLNGKTDYNLYRGKVQLEGSQDFPSSNTISWSGGCYWLSNEIMRQNGFAQGAIFHANLRDIYVLDWGFFLKGFFSIEAGNSLLKLRYEAALRKAWKSETFVEGGYFGNQGGIFPTQGCYLRNRTWLSEKLSLSAGAKAEWEGPDSPKYRSLDVTHTVFLKSVGNVEGAYALRKKCEILLGIDYTYFNTVLLTDFPSRGGIYGGIRTWW